MITVHSSLPIDLPTIFTINLSQTKITLRQSMNGICNSQFTHSNRIWRDVYITEHKEDCLWKTNLRYLSLISQQPLLTAASVSLVSLYRLFACSVDMLLLCTRDRLTIRWQ